MIMLRFLRWGDYVDYPGGLKCAYKRKRGRRIRFRDVTGSRVQSDVEGALHQAMQPFQAEKGKEMDSPLGLPGGLQLYPPILDF